VNLFQLLIFKGSRKVSFGVWLFIVANAYLWFKVIQSSDWMACVALASALVGGGTLGDKYFASKKQDESPKP
jgi:hypothetical protein